MLIERGELKKLLHKLWDLSLTAGAFICAYFVKKDVLPEPWRGLIDTPNYYIVLLLIIIIWWAVFSLFQVYATYRKQTFLHIFGNMLKAAFTAMLALILLLYLLKIGNISRIMMGLFLVFDVVLLTVSKGIGYWIIRRYWNKESNLRKILIVGSKERSRDVINTIQNYLDIGYTIMGCLEVDESEVGREVKDGIKVIGTVDSLKDRLLKEVIDELIIAMPLRDIKNADEILQLTEKIGISFHIVPDWQLHHLLYRPSVATLSFETFLGIPTMTISSGPFKNSSLIIKQAFDFLFAGCALLVLSPLFALFAGAIKLVSPGPVFYKQERSGINGRRFQVYKFRTMVPDADEMRSDLDALNEAEGPVFKIKDDPRIIPVIGKFLRKTGLDELPQLINIMKGEMSLIGPRPPIPEEVEKYEVWQRRRLSMKPGITCLWQVNPNRNEMDFRKWMDLDLLYIDTWSLWLDFKIFFKTFKVIFTASGR